jgi:hypothetical protein
MLLIITLFNLLFDKKNDLQNFIFLDCQLKYLKRTLPNYFKILGLLILF